MIERRKPLKRTAIKVSIEQVRAWQRKPRKPLPKVGPAKRRTLAAERAAKAALVARSGGRCEAFGIRYTVPHVTVATEDDLLMDVPVLVEVCGQTTAHPGLDPHHLWTSDRDRNVHDPARMLFVCRAAHNWIDAHPDAARELGLYKRDGDA